MNDTMTGDEVVAQSQDNSWWNRDPLLVKAAVVGVTTSILLALGAFGLVSEEQRGAITHAVGETVYWAFVLLPLVISFTTALWARLSVVSPRTAAKIAVRNAALPTGSAPTMLTPP
jgi:uncharacterized membrane protein